jgi:acyl-CoA hydrolase
MEKTDNLELVVEKIIENAGPHLVVGTPLAVGKPNHLLNALYQKVKNNREMDLVLLTALSLQKPGGSSFYEKKFFGPLNKRIFGNYPDLDYVLDRQRNALPSNIKVLEFYYPPGKLLNNSHAQRNYLSSNYTHAVRDNLNRGINVLCQQVAKGEIDGKTVYSLSCNTDITGDIIKGARERGMPLYVVGQVNQDLPFMYGESILSPADFDLILDNATLEFKVFAPPKMSVTPTDYMIGFHSSSLVKDDGEIQIGIGSLGDALVYALCLRQENNDVYQNFLDRLDITSQTFPVLRDFGSRQVFQTGLFAATEMFVDSFIYLFKSGILKKKVYDNVVIQRLLNNGEIHENFNPGILELLLREKAISSTLSQKDFDFLIEFGIFKKGLLWENGYIRTPEGMVIEGDLMKNPLEIKSHCLGKKLRNGAVSHAGFFLGPSSFYQFLKDLPVSQRKLIRMKQVSNINHLFGHEEIDRLQRKNGRFINNCMKVTLNGSACSDALEDGRQVSGVGGQYNFVSMAQELPDARSILQLKSTRMNSKGKLESNIIFNYGNCTIPRHLRDIVVTEYGIADLRSKTDEEVAIELIQIADSRFQSQLMARAKKAGKLPYSFKLKDRFKNNLPWRYQLFVEAEQENGYFNAFPFGTDFSQDEIRIGKALKYMAKIKKSRFSFLLFVLGSFLTKLDEKSYQNLLVRMELDKPKAFKEKILKKILLNAFEKASV